MPFLIGIAVLFIAGVGVMIVALSRNRQGSAMDERLSTFTERQLSLEELELQLPFRERILAPFVKNVLSLLGKTSPGQNVEKLKHNLELAGNPNGLTPSMFVGIRIVLTLVLFVIFFFVTGAAGMPLINRLMYTAVGTVLGFMLPVLWLGRKIKTRKHNILKSMPDALDLLSISVEAGLGFDLALQRVADKWVDELAGEFTRVLSDTRLGIPRKDAMRNMASRCDVNELSGFVSAIIQAEQLGVSIGKILKVQSEQMRIRRRQRAEELAHQAPIKMLFPMAFLIFPSILVVILGPALPKLMGPGAAF